MSDKVRKVEKAYKNIEFLNSPDARILRILSEFLEPMRRFRKQKIKDTIVFFGSARVKSKAEATEALRELEQDVRQQKGGDANVEQMLKDARTDLEMSRYYEDAVELSRRLTEWSRKIELPQRFVVCSGGGPGIMEAANKGAALAKGKSIGLNISLPFEQYPNAYIPPELNFEFHYFFMRKFWFVYLAKALVMFPGGFGTLDELMEVLTLMQTSKVKKKMTVVMYGREYWSEVLNFKAMVAHRVISPAELELIQFADTPEEAFRTLTKELRKNYPKDSWVM
jgi:uncharacterized protein (TIGR00730 family)